MNENKVGNAEGQGILNKLIDDLYDIAKEMKNEGMMIDSELSKIYPNPPDLSDKKDETLEGSTIHGRLFNLSVSLKESLALLKDSRITLKKLVE